MFYARVLAVRRIKSQPTSGAWLVFWRLLLFLLCFFSLLMKKKITGENGRQAGKVFFKKIILGEFTHNIESQEGSGSCLDVLREEKALMRRW